MGKLSDWANAVSDSIRINRSLAAGERVKYLLPFLLAGALFLFDLYCHGWEFRWSSMASSLILMYALLLLLPPDFEPVSLSVVLIVSTTVMCVCPSVICLFNRRVDNIYAVVSCFVAPTMLTLQMAVRAHDKYSGINFLSRNVTILHNREDYLRLSHSFLVIYFSVIVLCSIFFGGILEVLVCAVAALASFVLVMSLEVRARIGLAYYTDKVSTKGQAAAVSSLVSSGSQQVLNKDRMLYDRVESYMKEQQPYLEDGFSLTELAATMLTNKSYLSRTINQYSGYNFCQYVNKYRVEYAIEMMRKDKRIKVLELAMTSGFHSVASFNMAFKLHTNDTPSEFMRTIHLCDGY